MYYNCRDVPSHLGGTGTPGPGADELRVGVEGDGVEGPRGEVGSHGTQYTVQEGGATGSHAQVGLYVYIEIDKLHVTQNKTKKKGFYVHVSWLAIVSNLYEFDWSCTCTPA